MQREVTVKIANSMEATPIANLVQLANRFQSSIYFQSGNAKVNAKSIMGMMSLVLTTGSNVIIDAQGEDEAQAIEEISGFLAS